jgi:hypothetical protein
MTPSEAGGQKFLMYEPRAGGQMWPRRGQMWPYAESFGANITLPVCAVPSGPTSQDTRQQKETPTY